MRTDLQPVIAIDQGNTLVKMSVVCGGRIIDRKVSDMPDIEMVCTLMQAHDTNSAIYSSVSRLDVRFAESLRMLTEGKSTILSSSTALPIEIRYASPDTLGHDRIAAAAGAAALFPEEGVLVVDAGTALTIDVLLPGGIFKGGNISPGASLRLKSLNDYTERLPLVEQGGDTPCFGYDTETAIRAGVMRGIVGEIMYAMGNAQAMGVGKLVLTGGDAPAIMELLPDENNLNTVHEPGLVALGLENIYRYNERYL